MRAEYESRANLRATHSLLFFYITTIVGLFAPLERLIDSFRHRRLCYRTDLNSLWHEAVGYYQLTLDVLKVFKSQAYIIFILLRGNLPQRNSPLLAALPPRESDIYMPL